MFPDLVATTRGWLSPGTHAPLVATGGTGNDEFTVYSNQAELRLEGDDDNDLFIVRAFALAAVCDTSTDADTDCDLADIEIDRDGNGLYPLRRQRDGVCNAGSTGYAGVDAQGQRRRRRLRRGRRRTAPRPGPTTSSRWTTTASRGRGSAPGFSTGRPLDIRTGGGDDEVQYNVNAPVSVDGGTGIDKLVVLGTEFADDIVITSKGIYGAGLNVRYSTVEIVEVDGLEGDDEFFVQSTAFGVAYRVIGGLGSDTINVTGDVIEDIVIRELEGVSGTWTTWSPRRPTPATTGCPSTASTPTWSAATSAWSSSTETDGFTAVREGGPVPGRHLLDPAGQASRPRTST